MPETFVTVERQPDNVALDPAGPAQGQCLVGRGPRPAPRRRRVAAARPPGAVVLWGGRRIFAAGADIVELDESAAPAVGANFAARAGRPGVDPAGDHRRRQRLRARRRAGAGAGLRLPRLRRGRAHGAARGAARGDPRRGRHAAPAPAHRFVAGQGADPHRPPGAGRGGTRHRAGEPRGARRTTCSRPR